MSLIECPDCHAQVSDQAVACTHCGHPIAGVAVVPIRGFPRKKSQSRWRWIIGGVIAAFILVGLCTSAANKGQSDSATTAATSAVAAAAPAASATAPAAPATAPAAQAIAPAAQAIATRTAAAPTPTKLAGPPTPTALPGVGQRSSSGEWAAELTAVEPVGKIGNEVPQGRFVVVTVGMTNLHNQTSALNSWDFVLKSADGATFSPSPNGDTALAFTPGPSVPVFTVQVQPGLTQPLRIAFDVNPTINRYTFEAARIPFRVNLG